MSTPHSVDPMSNDAFEESFKVSGAQPYMIHRTEMSEGRWYDHGAVVTRWGIVALYTQSGRNDATRYDFVHKGRRYLRHEQRSRTRRGLVIEASKFARRIANA